MALAEMDGVGIGVSGAPPRRDLYVRCGLGEGGGCVKVPEGVPRLFCRGGVVDWDLQSRRGWGLVRAYCDGIFSSTRDLFGVMDWQRYQDEISSLKY